MMYSFAMLASVLSIKERSKCAASGIVEQIFEWKTIKYSYSLNTHSCEINAFEFKSRGVQAMYGLLDDESHNDHYAKIKQKLENSKQITSTYDHYEKRTFETVSFLYLENNLELYKMAENMYKVNFKLNVVCVDAVYRYNSKKASTFFHLDRQNDDYRYSRMGFQEELQTKYKYRLRRTYLNVWINLGKTIGNYPLGFIFDYPENSLSPQRDTSTLDDGEYDVYYYKDMSPGTVLFFKSSEIVHGAIKFNDEPAERSSLEFRCMEKSSGYSK
eukprot:NODE_583_length_5729_cov_0.479574.p2 type:complete len:272 gc:universal NODE_583_length_5729_cov_0.479574:1753-2568(+)